MKIRKINEISLDHKTVFIRCDFNVPLDSDGQISDDRRIKSALSTIRYCIDHNAKIVLASHLGRPKKFDKAFSLKIIAKRLSILLGQEVLISNTFNKIVDSIVKNEAITLKSSQILLLENLRFDERETSNDKIFAKELASLADIYINDAFGVCHRKHASVNAITEFFDDDKKACGFLLYRELHYLDNYLGEAHRPFTAIIGGSKVSSKLQTLVNLLTKIDNLIIGGAMAFTFLKALGEDVGKSLVEDELLNDAKNIMKQCQILNVKLYLPVDLIVAQTLSDIGKIQIVTTKSIPKNYMGLDIGPASVRLFNTVIASSETILWNGPMGVFEIDKFARGSRLLSHKIAESLGTTIVGGGDTAHLVDRAGDSEDISFISTGGGASLELLEGKKLPGIEPLLIRK